MSDQDLTLLVARGTSRGKKFSFRFGSFIVVSNLVVLLTEIA